MADLSWRQQYSVNDPPRRLWAPRNPPARPGAKAYVWMGSNLSCFFPVTRVARLLGNETADNTKEVVPDALIPGEAISTVNLIYGDIVSPKARSAEIELWITNAQCNEEINEASKRLAAHGMQHAIAVAEEFKQRTVFYIDILPSDIECPPDGLYWKLRPDTFKSISVGGGWSTPHEAYISLTTYDYLTTTPDIKWKWSGENLWLPIRDEYCEVKWMECSDKLYLLKKETWEDYYKESTLACEKGSEKTRRTNPELNLTIFLTGVGRLPMDTLRTVFGDVQWKTRQTCHIVTVQPEPDQFRFISRSPFGHYETYLTTAQYEHYIASRGDYSKPASPVPGLNMLLEVNVDLVQAVNVSSENILNAVGERSDLPSHLKNQGVIMGRSATEIAIDLDWPDAVKRIGNAGHGPTWPATNNFPAEVWLHRSAFSWGGIDAVNPGDRALYTSSQVKTNLIFGSSETNSLMTRFEKSWQMLFLRERDIMAMKGLPTPHNFKGKLTTTVVPIQEYPWLADTLQYRLELLDKSFLLGPEVKTLETTFYPFQRPLFTAIEAEADRRIISLMWAAEIGVEMEIEEGDIAEDLDKLDEN